MNNNPIRVDNTSGA